MYFLPCFTVDITICAHLNPYVSAHYCWVFKFGYKTHIFLLPMTSCVCARTPNLQAPESNWVKLELPPPPPPGLCSYT